MSKLLSVISRRTGIPKLWLTDKAVYPIWGCVGLATGVMTYHSIHMLQHPDVHLSRDERSEIITRKNPEAHTRFVNHPWSYWTNKTIFGLGDPKSNF